LAARKLVGKTQPRLWTPPNCTLTRRTSLGYDACDLATLCGLPPLKWQRWFLIHALELERDRKTLRFRQALGMTGRQNGKTRLAAILALYRLYVMGSRLVLGVAQDLAMARETELAALEMIESCPWLACDLAETKRGNGNEWFRVAPAGPIGYDDTEEDESFTMVGGSRYKIAAANRKAGRGLSVDLLFADEIAQWHTRAPWAALSKTTTARANSQILMITNAGDQSSTVLNTVREGALSGRSDHIGIFEWSAPDGCELGDTEAWRQSNPSLGYLFGPEALETSMVSDDAATFRAEVLCQRVDRLDGAVSWHAWQACSDPAGTLDGYRDRVCACVDVAPGGEHVTLAVAARLPDGRVRVEIPAAWTSTDEARRELPDLLSRIRPQTVSWYPAGPGGSFATLLRQRPGNIEITGTKAAECCMEFADLVSARRVTHPGDDLLDAQLAHAGKQHSADGWRFSRNGDVHCDAAYAAAGAVSAALALPEPKRARIRLLG
jgi:hypothetical protein